MQKAPVLYTQGLASLVSLERVCQRALLTMLTKLASGRAHEGGRISAAQLSLLFFYCRHRLVAVVAIDHDDGDLLFSPLSLSSSSLSPPWSLAISLAIGSFLSLL
jgi:hypothetical protein